jgi:hypothetical protein
MIFNKNKSNKLKKLFYFHKFISKKIKKDEKFRHHEVDSNRSILHHFEFEII